jgi:hypothetical protein
MEAVRIRTGRLALALLLVSTVGGCGPLGGDRSREAGGKGAAAARRKQYPPGTMPAQRRRLVKAARLRQLRTASALFDSGYLAVIKPQDMSKQVSSLWAPTDVVIGQPRVGELNLTITRLDARGNPVGGTRTERYLFPRSDRDEEQYYNLSSGGSLPAAVRVTAAWNGTTATRTFVYE